MDETTRYIRLFQVPLSVREQIVVDYRDHCLTRGEVAAKHSIAFGLLAPILRGIRKRKLPLDQELLIVQDYKSGQFTQRALASKYGLALLTINRILESHRARPHDF